MPSASNVGLYFVAGGLWGSTFLFLKLALEELSPLTVAMLRHIIGALSLWSFLGAALLLGGSRAFFRRELVKLKDRKMFMNLLSMAVVNNLLPQVFASYGLVKARAGLGSAIMSSTPLFTVLLRHMLLPPSKRPPWRKRTTVGVSIGLGGLFILLLLQTPGLGPSYSDDLGAACLMACASVCFALGSILGKTALGGIHPLVGVTGQITLAAVLNVLVHFLVLGDLGFEEASGASSTVWAAVIEQGVGSTAIGFSIYHILAKAIGPTWLISVTMLFPVFGYTEGALFLGETNADWFLAGELIGTALILLGLSIVLFMVRARRLCYHCSRLVAACSECVLPVSEAEQKEAAHSLREPFMSEGDVGRQSFGFAASDAGMLGSGSGSGQSTGVDWVTQACCCCCDISEEGEEEDMIDQDDYAAAWGASAQYTFSEAQAIHDKLDPSMWVIPFNKVRLVEIVGVGASGYVHRAIYAGTTVAVKEITSSTAVNQDDIRDEFRQEALILSKLNHPCIVRFLGISLGPKLRHDGAMSQPRSKLYIITEFCPASLSHLLYTETDPIPVITAVSYALDVAQGMHFLHDRNVMHRDLKPSNVLVDVNGKCKICDFGISTMIQSDETQKTRTGDIGTPAYMAPELITGDRITYSGKLDVYSYGILLFTIFARERPYFEFGGNAIALLVHVRDGRRPALEKMEGTVPQVVLDLMPRCWAADPADRPEFEEVVTILEELLENLKAAEEERVAL